MLDVAAKIFKNGGWTDDFAQFSTPANLVAIQLTLAMAAK